jgi:metallophosphoesterase (TIGR00282 family)
MNILYIGDVMGEPGLGLVEKLLPKLKRERKVDFVVAQAENVTAGKGVSPEDFRRLRVAGVDACSGGNWSLQVAAIKSLMNDPAVPIVRPANYPSGMPGLGYKYVSSSGGDVLVVSLLGQVVGRDADKPVDNPLAVIDQILDKEKDHPKAATIVNFHGDYSSEKKVIGYYLDGRVTAVIGDHWHVPTVDAMVLPSGTAHITDVGMCGSLDSSLGVKLDVIINRWRSGQQSRNELEASGRMQFNALLVKTSAGGLAEAVEAIQVIEDA